MSETNISAVSTPILFSTRAWRACPEYWRLYLAWVDAPERARDGIRAKMRDHIAVCGCRMGLGGKWSPMDEPIHEDEKSGGW